MERYHEEAVSRQILENSFAPSTEKKRLFLAARLRALQVQLRHGRDVYAADIARLARYCADSGRPEERS
jgi:hypothetical protein